MKKLFLAVAVGEVYVKALQPLFGGRSDNGPTQPELDLSQAVVDNLPSGAQELVGPQTQGQTALQKNPGARLEFWIIRGHGLIAKDKPMLCTKAGSDPFIKAYLADKSCKKMRTPTIWKYKSKGGSGLCPEWTKPEGKVQVIDIFNPGTELKFDVYDDERTKKARPMGSCSLPLHKLPLNQKKKIWLRVREEVEGKLVDGGGIEVEVELKGVSSDPNLSDDERQKADENRWLWSRRLSTWYVKDVNDVPLSTTQLLKDSQKVVNRANKIWKTAETSLSSLNLAGEKPFLAGFLAVGVTFMNVYFLDIAHAWFSFGLAMNMLAHRIKANPKSLANWFINLAGPHNMNWMKVLLTAIVMLVSFLISFLSIFSGGRHWLMAFGFVTSIFLHLVLTPQWNRNDYVQIDQAGNRFHRQTGRITGPDNDDPALYEVKFDDRNERHSFSEHFLKEPRDAPWGPGTLLTAKSVVNFLCSRDTKAWVCWLQLILQGIITNHDHVANFFSGQLPNSSKWMSGFLLLSIFFAFVPYAGTIFVTLSWWGLIYSLASSYFMWMTIESPSKDWSQLLADEEKFSGAAECPFEWFSQDYESLHPDEFEKLKQEQKSPTASPTDGDTGRMDFGESSPNESSPEDS